ncbi:SBBP repeat-containing protein [candidate division KSB1 bacterium]|nr:SBBP repeat-containing protein [candidate division KSB1 bacterium]
MKKSCVITILLCSTLIVFSQPKQSWVQHYASGHAVSKDYGVKIITDDSGYVYVSGYITNIPFGTDFLTIKYDIEGSRIWTAIFDGGFGDDIATSMCVDQTGNIYVTGYSVGDGTGYDFVTVKYDPSGTEKWVSRYNGQENSNDMPNDITFDNLGNIYVTGQSMGTDSNYDYVTVKYDSSGVEQWVKTYNGTGNGDDVAVSISVQNKPDSTCYLYVSGYSLGDVTANDFTTIKYTSQGEEMWISRYNWQTDSDDIAKASTVDDSGNVYITGYKHTGSYRDIITVKYDSLGDHQWTARYNGPANKYDEADAIIVDDEGNVYITGNSGGERWGSSSYSDIITIKYNSSGTEQWANRYDGPSNSLDDAYAILLDRDGNVYITGRSYQPDSNGDYITIKYTNYGSIRWKKYYTGPGKNFDRSNAIALDRSGNIFITGYSMDYDTDYDIVTVMYNASGTEKWIDRYNGPGNSDDSPTDFMVDSSGNVYVTTSSQYSGNYNSTIVKYDHSGDVNWSAQYNGQLNYGAMPNAIAADNQGNIYITGYSKTGGERDNDFATLKYNSNGIEQWAAYYRGPDRFNFARAIAVDDLSNVYVTGWSDGIGWDFATVKYNTFGEEQWVARYNGPDNDWDEPCDIAVDKSGNVYVTGASAGTSNYDFLTVKYDSSGIEQWTARYNNSADKSDYPVDLFIDEYGNVYVTGTSYYGNTGITTIKYNPEGVEQWIAYYNSPAEKGDHASKMAVDQDGNVYVTGYSYNTDSSTDYVIVKYNSSGIEEWVNRYDGTACLDDFANDIAIDKYGNIYVTGYSKDTVTKNDFVTIKYDKSGVEKWTARYNGPGNGDDNAISVKVDDVGNIYVLGSSSSNDWNIVTLIKYSAEGDPVFIQEQTSLPKEFRLDQNFPNPFNLSTVIPFSLPAKSEIELVIYNSLGKKIRSMFTGVLPSGDHKLKWDGIDDSGKTAASGIYFYHLKIDHKINLTGKMILIK